MSVTLVGSLPPISGKISTTDELDIEAVLDFAEKVSLDAPRLWLEANLDQRQRFQMLLFPEGLEVSDGQVRTTITASFYEELGSFIALGERLVAHTGFEPVLPA